MPGHEEDGTSQSHIYDSEVSSYSSITMTYKEWVLYNSLNPLPLCSLEIFEMTTGMLCSAPP